MNKVYIVIGYNEKDGQGVYAEREGESIIGVYTKKEKAGRVARFLESRTYRDFGFFDVVEETVK